MIQDLEETFESLCRVNLRLNPEKCVFGVPSGKLLGFLVSHRGIEANPEKIKAIEDMSPPQTLKEMQKLAGAGGRIRAFHLQTRSARLTFLQAHEEEGPIRVEPGGRPGLPRPQEIPY